MPRAPPGPPPVTRPSCVADAHDLLLDPGGRALAARRFGTLGGPRVLALHGWLDNANSFAPLAAALPELDFVALDLPGHGHSAHRPARTWYHYIDYLDDVLAALDDLGWQQCVLLGHSLGGAVASVLAAAHPARVSKLLLIEALGPIAARPGAAVDSWRRALTERALAGAKQVRTFPAVADAVTARMRANGLSEPAARLLVERSLAAVDGGWAWRSDPRLTVATPVRIHEDAIREWLAAIACPTLLIAADPSPPYFEAGLREARMACVRDLRSVVLPGNHHLHLEDPAPVAQAIRDFLAA